MHTYNFCVSNNSNVTSEFSALCLYNYAEQRLYTESYICTSCNVLRFISLQHHCGVAVACWCTDEPGYNEALCNVCNNVKLTDSQANSMHDASYQLTSI